MMSDRRRAAIERLSGRIHRRGASSISTSLRTFDAATRERKPSPRSRACLMSHDRRFAAVLYRRIYPEPYPTPWRQSDYLPDLWQAPSRLTPAEFVWLAGWLEGEGSFLAPPPSSPKLPRISAHSRDRDVMCEVGGLLGVKPVRGRDRRAAGRGWSPLWRVLKQGRGASRSCSRCSHS